MKTNIATTQDQSQRLLRCGVSADTADMCWYKTKAANKEGYSWMLISENYLKRRSSDEFVPAWSLSALLTKVLPSDVDLRMLKLGTGAFNNPNAWSIMYSADLYTEHSDIFEACVLMAEKLVANGYKLNEQ